MNSIVRLASNVYQYFFGTPTFNWQIIDDQQRSGLWKPPQISKQEKLKVKICWMEMSDGRHKELGGVIFNDILDSYPKLLIYFWARDEPAMREIMALQPSAIREKIMKFMRTDYFVNHIQTVLCEIDWFIKNIDLDTETMEEGFRLQCFHALMPVGKAHFRCMIVCIEGAIGKKLQHSYTRARKKAMIKFLERVYYCVTYFLNFEDIDFSNLEFEENVIHKYVPSSKLRKKTGAPTKERLPLPESDRSSISTESFKSHKSNGSYKSNKSHKSREKTKNRSSVGGGGYDKISGDYLLGAKNNKGGKEVHIKSGNMSAFSTPNSRFLSPSGSATTID